MGSIKKLLLFSLIFIFLSSFVLAVDLIDGNIAYYKYNESGSITDATGTQPSATNTGATFVSEGGIIDSAYSYDGNDKVDYNFVPPIGTNNRCFNIWVNYTSPFDLDSFFTYGTATTGQYINLAGGRTSEDTIQFAIYGAYIFYNAPNISDGNWHMVTLDMNFSVGSRVIDMTVYYDAVDITGSIDEQLNPTNTINTGSTYELHTGVSIRTNVDFFTGILDELYVRNKSCSQADVTSLYSSGIGNQHPFVLPDTTPPTFDFIPDNISLDLYNDSLYVDFNASDETEFDTFWINDTSYFSINDSGTLVNTSFLPINVTHLLVRINDTSNNNATLVFSVTVFDDTNPIISFVYPLNNTNYNDYNGTINFNLSEVVVNCTLNNTKFDYYFDNNISFTFLNNTFLNDSIYNINISCWDASLNNGSKILYFLIDTITPIHTKIYPLTSQFNTSQNLTYQSNWSDTNLYRVNVTLYNQSNDSVQNILYDNINDTNQSVSILFNFTYGEGNYTIEDCGTDDHNEDLGQLKKGKKGENILLHNTSNDKYTSQIDLIFLEKDNKLTDTPGDLKITIHNGDEWDISFTTLKPETKILFNISTNTLIKDRSYLGKQGHLLWGNAYHDFSITQSFKVNNEIRYATLNIIKINDTNYNIIWIPDIVLQVNDIVFIDPLSGGLNTLCVNTTIQYLQYAGSLNLLFDNNTHLYDYKTTFWENELITVRLNYTDEFGLIMNNTRGLCNVTLPNSTTINAVFDSVTNMWMLNDYISFPNSGNQSIQGECSNITNSVRYVILNESITILNIPPLIIFNNLTYLLGVLNLTDNMSIVNATGSFLWYVNITDDDLDTISYSIYNGTGNLIFSNQTTNTSFIFETPEGLFYSISNIYNLTVWANDTDGDITYQSIRFNITPIFRILFYVNRTPNNLSIQVGNHIWIEVEFNSTLDNLDNISGCIIEFDGVNYTGNIDIDYCYEEFVGLVDGTNYSFNVFINDTNNFNYSAGYRKFTENSVQPPINISDIIFNDSVIRSNEDLLCTANITGNDPEGNTTFFNITLFVNDIIIISQQTIGNNLSLNNTNYNKTDNITCQVFLYDGYEYSNGTNNSILISNSIPTVSNVNITGIFIDGILYSNMSVIGNYTFSDNDSDSDSSIFGFWINDTFYNTTYANLTSNYTSKGDIIIFMVTPYDGFDYGIPVNSSPVTIYGIPPTIWYLSPNQGYFSKYIPIECYASNDDNDQVYYWIDMYYDNGTNITWHSILSNYTVGSIRFSLKNISTQNNVSIRCNVTTDYVIYINKTTTGAISFVDKPEAQLSYIGARKIIIEKTPYRLGIICDIRSSNTNLSVYGSWGDCGNNGLKDYYWKESAISLFEEQRTLHQFTCISLVGLEQVSAGCIFKKTNINDSWVDVCENLPYTEQLCTYEVGISFEVFER